MTFPSRSLVPAACLVILAAPAAAQTRDPCGDLHTRRQTHIVHNSKDTQTIRLEDQRCRLEARLRGQATFTPDFRGIAGLAPGASFALDEDAGGVSRRIELSDDGRGGVDVHYRVGRDTRAFDAQAQAWFADRLLLLYRVSGLAAQERAEWLYRTGGVEALLREAGEVQSSSGRGILVRYALTQPDLDEAGVVRLLRTALPSSSSARTSILLTVADRRPLTGAVAEAYLDAVAGTSSSARQRELLERALRGGGAPTPFVLRAVETAGGLSSSSQLSALLRVVASDYTFDDALLRAYLDAAARISSSAAARDALAAMLSSQELTDAQLVRALRSVGRLSASTARGDLLVQVARSRQLEGAARSAYVDVATSISSSAQRARALEALERGPVSRRSGA